MSTEIIPPETAAAPPAPSPYVILCDAGSTGTRLYVYSLPPSSGQQPQSQQLPHHAVQIQEGPKIRPGLSSQTPETAGTYLLPAFESALAMIPPEHHATTPVYVYATAGMRLLEADVQESIYDALSDGLRSHPAVVPFVVERDNLGTIDGEDEGYFAALAVNYLGGVIGSDLVALPDAAAGIGSGGGTGSADGTTSSSDGLPDRNDLDRRHNQRQLSWFGTKKGAAADGADGNGGHRPPLLGALDLGGASAQIVFDASTLAPSHRRRLEELQEAVERRNGHGHPYMYAYGQADAAVQVDVDIDRNRPRALASSSSAPDPTPFQGGLRGAGADGIISTFHQPQAQAQQANGRPISRNDFFSLSLLGYGGERMRDSIDAYLEEEAEAGRQRTRRLRRRLQAANLRPTNAQRQRQQRNWADPRRADMVQRLMKKNNNNNKDKKMDKARQTDPNTIINPCYPPGYTVTLPSGYTHTGSGKGDVCMEHLDAVMERNARGSCDPGQFCVDLLGPGIEPPARSTFFAFTLFSYPLNFARDILRKIKDENGGKLPKGKQYKELHRIDKQLQEDNPSIKTLRDVTNAACAWDYPWLVEALPDEDRVAFRCMELGLATSLLTKFGFPDDGRNIHFTDEIGGASAEWTLGAYLHLLNHDGQNADAGAANANAPDGGSWYIHPTNLVSSSMAGVDSGMLYSDVAILIGALLSLAVCARMVVKRSWVSSVSRHAKDAGAKAVGLRMTPSRSISMPIR
mmetsp:Transcript_34541/g.101506  ORF Transcript_34541/g.101506 Transcript_34541/m.101506 type:complete len:744 (-) Transcript_34541:68-2299(-)